MSFHVRRVRGMTWYFALGMLLVLAIVAACGGGGAAAPEEPSTSGEQAGGGRAAPTMPSARFAQPTTMIDPTKVAETRSTPAAAEVDVEFGGQIYGRLCADCHGEQLEGVAGKAEPIEAYALNKAALTDLLRTGGGYGPEHLFGLDKVSPEGITSLQAYLETLASE